MSHFILNNPSIKGSKSYKGSENDFEAINASIQYSLLSKDEETFLSMTLSADYQSIKTSEYVSEALSLVFKKHPLYFRLPAGFEIAAEDFSRIYKIKFVPNADMSKKKYMDMETLTNSNESMARIIAFLSCRFSDEDLALMGVDRDYLGEDVDEEWEDDFYEKTGMHC